MELFRLFGSIFIKDEATKPIDDIDKKADGLGGKLGKMIGTATQWGSALLGGATVALGGLLKLADQTSQTADEIDKLSERTGINREELQRWKYAAGQSGADIGKLEVGMKTLSNAMDAAMTGNETAIASFEELGISVADLQNKSQEEIFDKVMNGLADSEQGAKRNALGNDLLGKSYTELLPLLNAGSEGMGQLKNRADELGLVMSEQAVKANVQFGDSMDDLKQSFGAVFVGLSNSVLPMLQMFVDFLIANMPIIQDIFGNVFSIFSTSVASFLPFLMQLIETALPPLIALFTDIGTNILPPLISLFTQIVSSILPVLINLFTNVVKTILPPLISLFDVIISQILPPFIDLFNNVINQILPPLISLFDEVISTLLPPLIDLFKNIIDSIMPVIIKLFSTFTQTVLPPLMALIDEIVKVILPPLLSLFNDMAQIVLPLVMSVFEALMPVIEPIMNAISAVISTVLALIKGDWEGVWNGIIDFFKNIIDAVIKIAEGFGKIFGAIFDGIGDVISKTWDWIIEGIKNAINWIIGGINSLIDGLNGVTNAVGDVIGVDLSVPNIPYLDVGTNYVPQDMLAVIHEGEAVVPKKYNPHAGGYGEGSGITVNINGATIFNERDADRLGELVVKRLRALGVN